MFLIYVLKSSKFNTSISFLSGIIIKNWRNESSVAMMLDMIPSPPCSKKKGTGNWVWRPVLAPILKSRTKASCESWFVQLFWNQTKPNLTGPDTAAATWLFYSPLLDYFQQIFWDLLYFFLYSSSLLRQCLLNICLLPLLIFLYAQFTASTLKYSFTCFDHF